VRARVMWARLLLHFCAMSPLSPNTLVRLAMDVKAVGYIVHAEFVLCHTVGTAYVNASLHSLLCVDALCAIRTSYIFAPDI